MPAFAGVPACGPTYQRAQAYRTALSARKAGLFPYFQYLRGKIILRLTGVRSKAKQHLAHRCQKIIPHVVSFYQQSRPFYPKRRLYVAVPLLFFTRKRGNGRIPAGRLTPMLGGRTSPRGAQDPCSRRGLSLGRAGKRLLFPRRRIRCDLNLISVYHILPESQAAHALYAVAAYFATSVCAMASGSSPRFSRSDRYGD